MVLLSILLTNTTTKKKEQTNLFMSLAGWQRNQGAPGTSDVLLVNVDTKTRISIRKLMPIAI